MWKHSLGVVVLGIGFVLLGLPIGIAHAEGHCNYRQLAPKQRTWHRVCQTPATPQTCDELVSGQKEQVEYVEGDCNVTGALGYCLISGSRLYFFQGDGEALVFGCEMMHGTWNPS